MQLKSLPVVVSPLKTGVKQVTAPSVLVLRGASMGGGVKGAGSPGSKLIRVAKMNK